LWVIELDEQFFLRICELKTDIFACDSSVTQDCVVKGLPPIVIELSHRPSFWCGNARDRGRKRNSHVKSPCGNGSNLARRAAIGKRMLLPESGPAPRVDPILGAHMPAELCFSSSVYQF